MEIDPQIATPGDWLWRVTWHGETAFGVVYQAGTARNRAHLVASTDGVHYKLVQRFDLPGKPSEATVRFGDDGKMLIVIRNDGGDYFGRLGSRLPPVPPIGIGGRSTIGSVAQTSARPPMESGYWERAGTATRRAR